MKKRTNDRKLIRRGAVLLLFICVMALWVLPLSVGAAEGDAAEGAVTLTGAGTETEPYVVSTEAELTAALAAEGETLYINLSTNITATADCTIADGKTVILDLSGHTLDCSNHIIENIGTLELRDSNTGGTVTGVGQDVEAQSYMIKNFGHFTLTSGSMINSNNTDISGGAVYNDSGTVVVNGGRISALAQYGVGIMCNGSDAKLSITGGEIIGIIGIQNQNGTVNMTGGNVSGTTAISNTAGGYVSVSGGTVSTLNDYTKQCGIYSANATVTVSGDAVINALYDSDIGIYFDVYASKDIIQILGGRIVATGENAAAIEMMGDHLFSCLAPGNAFYDENGNVISLTEGQTKLIGTVTVGECNAHVGGTAGCTTLAKCAACGLEYGEYSHPNSDDNDYCDVCNGLFINTSTFPDVFFRDYIAVNKDTVKNGVLSAEEIAAVNILAITDMNISKLTGIGYFTSLGSLTVYGNNQITELDLSTCTKLTTLELSGNSALTTLDVSGCVLLETLSLRNCPAELVSSINLGVFTRLQILNLNGVKLTSLNLSGNTELTKLYIENTGLTSLDLSANTKITTFDASGQRDITHCCVGDVDMSQFGDVAKMTNITGGTMGEDGWLTLAEGATQITYDYATGSGDYTLPVTITLVKGEHVYEAAVAQKDEDGHYTEVCTVCHAGKEDTVAVHTYYSLHDNDATHHWRFCDSCRFKKVEAHIFISDCDVTCGICYAGRDIPKNLHTITGYRDNGNGYHFADCSACNDSELYWEHEYAHPCTEACVCGAANPDLVAHTPKYTVNGDMTHDVSCGVCAKLIEDNAACADSDNNLICDVCAGFMFPGLGTEQNPWQVDTFDELVAACIGDAFVKLVGDFDWSSGNNVHISGTTHLCLNGHTLDLTNSCIMVNAGGVLTVCDCADGAGTVTARIIPIFNYGTLILSGDPIITNDPNGSGGYGAVTMYSGAKIDAAAYAGGVVTLDLVRTTLGDVIVENVTEANQDKFRVTTRGYTLEQTAEGTLVMAALPEYKITRGTETGYGARNVFSSEIDIYYYDTVTLTITPEEGRKFLSVPTVTIENPGTEGNLPAMISDGVLQADGSYVFTLTNFSGDVTVAIDATAVLTTTAVGYMDADGIMQTTPEGVDVVIMEEETILLADGWYVVQDDVTLSYEDHPNWALSVSGDVKLILANNYIGISDIRVADGGTGSLTLYSTSSHFHALRSDAISCPITVNSGTLLVGNVAELTMNGGWVEVTGTVTQKTTNRGVLFENGVGTVYGDMTLTDEFALSLPYCTSLTIPQGATLTLNFANNTQQGTTLTVEGTLTIAEGKTLNHSGTMVVNGTVNGAVYNFGTVDVNGTITGSVQNSGNMLCGDLRIKGGTYGTDFTYDSTTDTLKISGGTDLDIYMANDTEGNPIAKSATVISVEGDAWLLLFGLNIETAGVPLSIADGVACTVQVCGYESTCTLRSTAKEGQYPGISIGTGASLTLEGETFTYLNIASASTSGIALSKDAALNVAGGRIDVVGGEYSPAIGSEQMNGTVTVTDGYITVGDSERGTFASCKGIYAKEITISGGYVDVYVIGGDGIYAPTVTIRGENTEVKTYGENGIKSGNLTIEGGTVYAEGMSSYDCSGIHIYRGGSCTISGGTVNISGESTNVGIYLEAANGMDAHLSVTGGVLNIADVLSASSIGSNGGTGTGTVAISGGTVNVTQAVNVASAEISGGIVTIGGNLTGTFTTTENGSAFISAAVIEDNDDTTGWRGLIYDGAVGKIYGSSFTLTESVTAPAGSTLTIYKDQTLNFADGAFLTVPSGATVNAWCTINGSEERPANPVSGFMGDGSFYHENPKLDVYPATTTHIYTGENIYFGDTRYDDNPIWWGGAEFVAIVYMGTNPRMEKDGQEVSILNAGSHISGDVGKYTYYVYYGQDHEGNDIVRTFSFEVLPKEVGAARIEFAETEFTYTGQAITPVITVYDGERAIPASEYTVAYSNNVEAGTATVTVTDVVGGNYTVSGSATFEIRAAAVLSQVSLTLDGDIGINFYWTLPQSVIADAEAYFRVTLPNGDTEQIPVATAPKGTPIGEESGKEYYKITGRVAAKEMAQDVTVEVVVSGGGVIGNAAFSVQDYALIILAQETDPEIVDLVKKMLNYGAAAQIALNYQTDAPANAVLDAADQIVADVDISALADATTSGTVSGFEYLNFSCILETKTTLRQYFTLPADAVSEYAFTIDGVSVTPTETTVGGQTVYYIDVADIAAKEMGAVHTLVVTRGEESREISCSVHSYIKAALIKNSEDAALVNAVKAMYAYNQSAIAYFN